jgi:DnaK suppressor protein
MDDAHAQELLTRARERIERSLAKLAIDDPENDAATDPGDDATNLHDREVELGMIDSLREELAAVERAEARIAEGTYGVSVESGDEIPDGRLEAVPWADRTAAEESRHEHGG